MDVVIMDYKHLLMKYMSHVINCEGTDFLSNSWKPASMWTEEEWKEMQKISAEC